MNLATGTVISQLPTGTIDALNAAIPLNINVTGTPQTIRATLLQTSTFLQSQGQMISGSYGLLDGRYQGSGTSATSATYPAHIDGLNIEYTTSGSITVQPGSAYIPSLGSIIFVTGSITQSVPIVTGTVSGTYSHVYLTSVAGVPSIQVTGTSPSSPYYGLSKTKNGDAAYRYIGSIYHDSGGYLFRFSSNSEGNTLKIAWNAVSNAEPFLLGTSLTATTPTALVVTKTVPTPLAGTIREIETQMVLNLALNGDMNAAVGETLEPSNPTVAGDLNVRMSTSAAATLFLPSHSLKLKGTSIQYAIANNAGSNSLSLRAKGITIQR